MDRRVRYNIDRPAEQAFELLAEFRATGPAAKVDQEVHVARLTGRVTSHGSEDTDVVSAISPGQELDRTTVRPEDIFDTEPAPKTRNPELGLIEVRGLASGTESNDGATRSPGVAASIAMGERDIERLHRCFRGRCRIKTYLEVGISQPNLTSGHWSGCNRDCNHRYDSSVAPGFSASVVCR
jgi:hypothetical protein